MPNVCRSVVVFLILKAESVSQLEDPGRWIHAGQCQRFAVAVCFTCKHRRPGQFPGTSWGGMWSSNFWGQEVFCISTCAFSFREGQPWSANQIVPCATSCRLTTDPRESSSSSLLQVLFHDLSLFDLTPRSFHPHPHPTLTRVPLPQTAHPLCISQLPPSPLPFRPDPGPGGRVSRERQSAVHRSVPSISAAAVEPSCAVGDRVRWFGGSARGGGRGRREQVWSRR